MRVNQLTLWVSTHAGFLFENHGRQAESSSRRIVVRGRAAWQQLQLDEWDTQRWVSIGLFFDWFAALPCFAYVCRWKHRCSMNLGSTRSPAQTQTTRWMRFRNLAKKVQALQHSEQLIRAWFHDGGCQAWSYPAPRFKYIFAARPKKALVAVCCSLLGCKSLKSWASQSMFWDEAELLMDENFAWCQGVGIAITKTQIICAFYDEPNVASEFRFSFLLSMQIYSKPRMLAVCWWFNYETILSTCISKSLRKRRVKLPVIAPRWEL